MNTNRPTAAQQKESDETALAVWQAAATAPSNKSALRRYTMRNKFMVIGLIGIVIGVLLSTAVVLAGSLNPSVGPTGAASQMFTLQQIYDRLTSGAAGTKMTTFTEPGSGPGTSTMRTLDEIMAQAPAADNTNGASTAQVLSAKTFWGLRTDGTWGLQTGSLATQTLTDANATVADGYYAATTLGAVDADLAAGNIRSGVTIFGVAGGTNVVDTATGDALAADLLSGKKAWVDGAEVTGSIATQTLSNANDTVAAGNYAATTLGAVDTDLAVGNIRSGVTIFGVAGKTEVVDTTSGDAVAGEILLGKKAWVDGLERTGTIATQTLTDANATVADGYYAATTLGAVDADLAAGNIRSGVTIFGVAGTVSAGSSAGVPQTGQTSSVAIGDDGNLQKGVAWPNPRFTDNANGTVTDNLTGLIWLKDANCYGTRSWAQALSDANALASGSCSLIDGSTAGQWRLPNLREMQSLVHYGFSNPAVPNTAGTGQWTPGNPFTNVQSGDYWSSTASAGFASFAWLVTLSHGDVYNDDETGTFYMWPVRGGQ